MLVIRDGGTTGYHVNLPARMAPRGFDAAWRSGTRLAVASVVVAVILAATAGVAASAGGLQSVTTTSPGWSVTLTLDSTSVRAGLPVTATLRITDNTGQSATVHSCAADGVYGINIENRKIPNGPVTGTVECSSTLRPGRNVFHRRVSTDYETCSENEPPCPEPLPAGVYHTVLNWPEFSARIPRPGTLTIRLTH